MSKCVTQTIAKFDELVKKLLNITEDKSSSTDKSKSIIQVIMDLWRQYKILRYIKKYPNRNKTDYSQVLNDYRAEKMLSEDQRNDLWEELRDMHYVAVDNGQNIRITAQGKDIIEFGPYGFIKTLVNQHLAPMTWLAALVAVADFAYRLLHHLWSGTIR